MRWGWLLLGVVLVEQTLVFFQMYAMQIAGARAMADLRAHVFRFLHGLRLGFFDRHVLRLADLAAALAVPRDPRSDAAASALARLARLAPDLVGAPLFREHPLRDPIDPPAPEPPLLDATLDVDRILRDLA